MYKKPIFISFLLLTFILQGCKNNASNEQKKLTDKNSIQLEDLSGTVRIPKNPQRVVVYSYPILDIMDELGLGEYVIGFSKQNTPDYLKKYKENDTLLDFGGTKDPNFERINSANPDLIIMEGRVEKDHDEFAKIAPTLYIQADYHNYIGSIKENVRKLGKIFGIEDRAEKEIKEMQEVVNTNKAPGDSSQKALVVMFNNGKFAAFGPNSRYGFIYDNFGVTPVAENIKASVHGYNISSEYIQEHNPDILYVEDKNAAHHEGDINKSGVENELIKQTDAYKNDKIIYLTPDLWYYGGGGLQGMKMMAKEISQAY